MRNDHQKSFSLFKKNETAIICVDAVNRNTVSLANQPILIGCHEKYLFVTGWAVDKRANRTFDAIYVTLDEKPYLATMGISRLDVVNHFNNPAFITSGFRVEIPFEDEIPGRHVIDFLLGSSDGTKIQGHSPVLIFKRGKKRTYWQLLTFEFQRLKNNPLRFLERAVAAIRHIFTQGLGSFLDYYLNRMYWISDNDRKYHQWIIRHESVDLWKEQRSIRFVKEPLISIVVSVHDFHEARLTAMIDSVICQTYSRWELCIACGNDLSEQALKVLKDFEANEPRIKLVCLSGNQGISGDPNAAISKSSGDFIALLDQGDLLNPDALCEMAKAINEHDDVDMLYSDEDHISSDGKLRMDPYFKPDFSPDLLRSGNYISHFLVIRKNLGEEVGWYCSEFDGAQEYDLVLKVSEKARKIVHVPRVLYHSTALGVKEKDSAQDAGRRALQEHLRRVGLTGEVVAHDSRDLYKINYSISVKPLVSIIIPNKDQADVLERCLRSVLDKSSYQNFEIIIVENNSQQKETLAFYKKISADPRVKVLTCNLPFNFSTLNNSAVLSSNGEVLLFLNNDTEVINADWIEQMLQYSVRLDVGAVGAKLYYPDKTLQHGGVIVGLGGVAGYVLKYYGTEHEDFSRLNRVQNYSAVTGACLMMRRKVFDEVGGFDEALAVAYNDVDLCLRVRGKGYYVIWTPFAQLIHHESRSRGYENTPEKVARYGREVEYFKRRWGGFLTQGDPFYNPNLTLATEDFSIKDA